MIATTTEDQKLDIISKTQSRSAGLSLNHCLEFTGEIELICLFLDALIGGLKLSALSLPGNMGHVKLRLVNTMTHSRNNT